MKGSIKKKAKEVWLIRYDLPPSPEGKRRQRWLTFHGSYRQAEARLAAELTKVNEGSSADAGQMTVGAYLAERWLPHIRARVRQRTTDSYEVMVRSHIVPHVGGVRLSKLTPADVSRMMDALADAGRLSPTSVKYAHRILKGALKQAVKWELLPRNPCDRVEPPRPEEPKTPVLTADGAATFLEANEADPFYPLYYLALMTGMRQGELLGLRWQDVDFERGFVAVTHQLTRSSAGLSLAPPKSHSGKRAIDLTPDTLDVLKRHRVAQNEARLAVADRWQRNDLVFPGPFGGFYGSRSLLRRFKCALERAGLPPMPFHGLRHTSATLLLLAGVHPKVAMDRLGHADESMFMSRYAHIIRGMQGEAAVKIEGLVLAKKRAK